MSGAVFTLTLEDGEIAAALTRLAAFGEDPSPALDDIGAELESSTILRIQTTNLAPDGTPWKPSLRASLTGGRTLLETGHHLRDSIAYRLDGKSAVEVGSNWEGAAVHQRGAVITAKGGSLHFTLANGREVFVKSVTIPARPYLGLSADDDRAVTGITLEHMAIAAFGESGGPVFGSTAARKGAGA